MIARTAFASEVAKVEAWRLISKGADVNTTDKNGSAPLHQAAGFGRADMVALLLQKGARVNPRNRDNETPLYRAGGNAHKKVVEILRKHGGEY